MKRLKIEMLTAVADVSNTYDIVTELSEYVTDVDAAIARESVQSRRTSRARRRSVRRRYRRTPAAVRGPRRGLRHRGDAHRGERSDAQISPMGGRVRDGGERHRGGDNRRAPAKAALVYLYGEYGQAMPEAPYMLEPLLEGFEEEESADVRLGSYSPRR